MDLNLGSALINFRAQTGRKWDLARLIFISLATLGFLFLILPTVPHADNEAPVREYRCFVAKLTGRIISAYPEKDRLILNWEEMIPIEISKINEKEKKDKAVDELVKQAEAEGKKFISVPRVSQIKFLIKEVFAPNFYGIANVLINEIIIETPACRTDTYVLTLLGPQELFFPSRPLINSLESLAREFVNLIRSATFLNCNILNTSVAIY